MVIIVVVAVKCYYYKFVSITITLLSYVANLKKAVFRPRGAWGIGFQGASNEHIISFFIQLVYFY